MSTDQQPQALAVIPEVVQLREYLQKRHDVAVSSLINIKKITNDDEYEEAEAICAKARALYEQMSAKRKQFTDPIKKTIEEIMVFENALNPTSKTENAYLRARSRLDEYNQFKIEEKKKAEHEAKLRADLMRYKAEFRAKVEQNLIAKLSGLHKNVLQGMVDWERKLTLDNINDRVEGLRRSNPALKKDHYDECFKPWGAEPMIMSEKSELEYLSELKKELPYEVYNEKFIQMVAPLKNEYLAKVPEIKKSLKEMAALDEKKRKEEAARQEEERKAKMEADLKAASERSAQEIQAVEESKDLNKMEADFTQQAMTSDLEAGPIKKVASFEDDKLWLNPLLQVISKCGSHPKFKGIMNAKGEYVPEVKKWLDFYAANIGEPIKGLTFEDKAKTIVRSK